MRHGRQGDADLRRPVRDRDGRRDPVQQEGLRGQRHHRPDHVGGVRCQQRQAQGGRDRPGRRDLRRGLTWTSQLFVLADYCNVQAAIPDFAEKYTTNQIKYATTPAALAGFKRLEEGFQKGWWQPDFGSATFDDGLNMLATGKIAQYPMLTFALSTIAGEPPRQHPGHRLLRAARRRRGQALRHDLDARCRLVHREDQRRTSRRRRTSWRSSARRGS